MPKVRMLQKYSSYNTGEIVQVEERTADKWCGENNPKFRVAVRVPEEPVQAEKKQPAKQVEKAPVNKMVSVDDSGAGKDT